LPRDVPWDDLQVTAFARAVIRANGALLGVRGEDRLLPLRPSRDARGFEVRFEVERRGKLLCVFLLRFDRRGALRSIGSPG
jgi:hypothetical protein